MPYCDRYFIERCYFCEHIFLYNFYGDYVSGHCNDCERIWADAKLVNSKWRVTYFGINIGESIQFLCYEDRNSLVIRNEEAPFQIITNVLPGVSPEVIRDREETLKAVSKIKKLYLLT